MGHEALTGSVSWGVRATDGPAHARLLRSVGESRREVGGGGRAGYIARPILREPKLAEQGPRVRCQAQLETAGGAML